MVLINYIGKHLPRGVYEVSEKHALVLSVDPNWVIGEVIKEEVKETNIRNELEKMNMKELREFVKTNNLKAKDNDKPTLMVEILEELGV